MKKGFITMLAFTLMLTAFASLGQPTSAAPGDYLLSLNRTAYASSVEGNNSPNLAVDGNAGSRWSSAWGTDPQWIYIDLGASATVNRVRIQWEGAYAKQYRIQVSNDESVWQDMYAVSNGDGGVDDLTVSGTGRYVRILGQERALAAYGYSIFEFEVYGTGGVNQPPVDMGPNLALNRPVQASSYEQASHIPAGSTLPGNATDGNESTRWGSVHNDNQWIQVDLGSAQTIGLVKLKWEGAAGRVFDLQVSNDGTSWTTVYREMYGQGGVQSIPVYASGRYVRMLGHARMTDFGYSLYELEVYKYVEGQPKPVYPIPALPTPSTVSVGNGSYLQNDITMIQPLNPKYRTSGVNKPLPSNDWWQSLMVKQLSDGLITLPLKSKYTQQGLSILNPGAGWINGNGSAVNASGQPDLYVMANNINTAKMETKVAKFGDFSVEAILSDDATEKMRTTFVKGSPYVYTTFADPQTAEIYSPVITRFFNGSNQTILASDGSITGDYIGIEVTNTDESGSGIQHKRYYGVFAPPGTVFQRAGSKLKLQLGSGQTYMSIAALPAAADLNEYYQHAYAFVTDTKVNYTYDESTSLVTTNFEATTSLKRSGFSSDTLLALYPHQWKLTTSPLTSLTYPSIRGTLKVREGNTFTVVDRFHGIVPTFTEPTNPEYSRQQLTDYLAVLDQETSGNLFNADAYWQGKQLHPLAMGVLIADEIGHTSYKQTFLSRMKTILSDWYTYTQGEPGYYFYYNDTWGTMYYKHSGFGANAHLTDHHFTYGYYVFASAVLAMYDEQFMNQYGDMVEHLIRDYANPSRTDSMYPYFRSFDPYQGHSWAGGYGDNDSGNNQEAAGESLFGWVGQYLWSLVNNDTEFRNAAIYGFTTELKAIEQYWFNYDGDNWLPQWGHKSVGQVYGSSYFYGTFFSGAPVHIYGIHWLPTAEYLTSYGFDPAKASALYNGFVADNGGPETEWQHIVWPIQALSDPQGVINKWSAANMQRNEIFNTYWSVNALASLGSRTKDIWATGWSGATVYKKGSTYTALVWNPTNAEVTVTFKNASGVTGTAKVAPKSLVTVNPMTISGGGDTGGGTGGTNVALNKFATATSTEGAFTAAAAVDGDPGTRWSSLFSDPQSITVDLGASHSINRVKLSWEAAYGKAYTIQTSADGTNWTTVYTAANGDGGTDDISFPEVQARYVKMNGMERATAYGYSLWEFEVYSGSGGGGSTSTTNLALNKTVVSSANPLMPAAGAVDGNAGTRWESQYSDPQWIQVDLGSIAAVNRVKLNWETAYGKSYSIQTSVDGGSWTTVYSTTASDGAIDDIVFAPVQARYVRVNGIERATIYGYSLWELEVYGT